MKNILLTIIIFIFSLSLNAAATDVIDNPAQPIPGPEGKKIDRTIKMTEVFRISDEQDGDFFLKSQSGFLRLWLPPPAWLPDFRALPWSDPQTGAPLFLPKQRR